MEGVINQKSARHVLIELLPISLALAATPSALSICASLLSQL